MKKGLKIVLRKRIQDVNMINGFEQLSKMKLPKPPLEIPVEEHMQALTWEMEISKESALNEYKKIAKLFNLPPRTNNVKRLAFAIHRKCWYDIVFEVYEPIL